MAIIYFLLSNTTITFSHDTLYSISFYRMPHVFRSRKEFSYWFSNPMNSIVDGTANRNDDLIGRLHGIIRPFVLRRMKKDVEKQMPGKFEHIVKCTLSRRQVRKRHIILVDLCYISFHYSHHCYIIKIDVSLRGVHGTVNNKNCANKRRQLHGNDECFDATS